MNHHLDQEVVAGFISEAKSYLPEIMLGLEAFAAAPEHHESIREAFRYAHIIKGAASMLGFQAISELAYQLEVRLEMLSEQQVALTEEMLEDLCQNVSDLADLLDTALSVPAAAGTFPSLTAAEAREEAIEVEVPASSAPAKITDFDFSFAPLYAGEDKETGATYPLSPSTHLSEAPRASFALEEPSTLSPLQETSFSVSLPELVDTPTVGELNLDNVAEALKESFGDAPLPPQPEFQLPEELLSALPDFHFTPPPAAAAGNEAEVLEIAADNLSEVSYETTTANWVESLADDLLADSPAPLSPEPPASPDLPDASEPEINARTEAPPEAVLPTETVATRAAESDPETESLRLLPLPELSELLHEETPVFDAPGAALSEAETAATIETTEAATSAPEEVVLATQEAEEMVLPTCAESALDEEILAPAPEAMATAMDAFASAAETIASVVEEIEELPAPDAAPPAPPFEMPIKCISTDGSLLSAELPEELLETFLLEAEEHLQIMQTALRTLEKTPGDIESLQEIRRSTHSLKGTAALVGFRNIMQLAHRMEDLLDLVFEEKFQLTLTATRLLMQATDLLEDMSNGQIDETALQQCYDDFEQTMRMTEDPLAQLENVTWEDLPEPELHNLLAPDFNAPAMLEEPPALLEEFTTPVPPTDAVLEDLLPDVEAASFPAPELLLPDLTSPLEPEPTTQPDFSTADNAVLTTPPPAPELIAEAPESETCTTPAEAEEIATTDAEPVATTTELTEPIVATVTATMAETTPMLTAMAEMVEEASTTLARTASPAPPTPVAAREEAASPTGALAQTSSQFLRVPIERLDEVVKLLSEMIITRTAFEQRLEDFARQVEELQIAGTRLRRASTNLESKYEASTLGGGKVSPGTTFAGANKTGLTSALVTHNTHGFDDLEFDRYTEFHLLSRELVESSSDIQTVGREFNHLNSDFLSYLNRQSRVYSELQDRLMRLRMVPLASIAPRLHRVVRQVSTQENKQVELFLEGEATAIDTTALQEMVDPLLHLLRNAVDHGIERPGDRLAKGKPAVGKITLRAFYEGSQVVLQLSDDGQGLNTERIHAKAMQLGFVRAEETLAPAELWSLIFAPGFSTAAQVSEISGRGVGMDVVQTTVQKLKGTIVIDSRPDVGTTFTIRLPLTLAVTRALMVKAHGQSFAIPLDVVTQIMRLDMSKVERIGKEPIIRVGGKIYPLLMLSRLLNLRQLSDEIAARPPALLINVAGQEVAVIVDQLLGGREIVIKTLGNHLRKVHGVMGATMMGSGEVVLILNLAELLRGTIRVTTRRTSLPTTEPVAKVSSAPAATSRAAVTTSESSAARPEPQSEPALEAKPESKAEKQTLTVMIVDDSPSVRRVSSNLIKNTGWIPLQAKDGLEALEKLQAGEAVPDLIMLDIEMPRMDGYQLLASLRALPAFRQLPIVIVSSRSSEKHRQKAFDLGATDYLAKPYQEDYVVALIRRLVQTANP